MHYSYQGKWRRIKVIYPHGCLFNLLLTSAPRQVQRLRRHRRDRAADPLLSDAYWSGSPEFPKAAGPLWANRRRLFFPSAGQGLHLGNLRDALLTADPADQSFRSEHS